MFLASALMACSVVAGAYDDVLARLNPEIDGGQVLRSALMREAEANLQRRVETLEDLKTPEALMAQQQAARERYLELLGPFPERTPLNAQLVGTGAGEGFRYEKIIWESQPNYFVTSLLFLPEGDGPYPGVIVPCGHSDTGKAQEAYQLACILLARNGIAALCYDPIGQGERYHFFREDGKPEFGTTLHHTVMGVGAILTGTSLATYRIFDGFRALDYLESRSDIDASRLGCTGNSGGGTLTSYIMALDDRVQVAGPSCYLTGFSTLLNTIGPQDAEQNVFAQLAGDPVIDHADYIRMRAPRPTIVLAATHDFFDIGGTWELFREAKRQYTMLGRPEALTIAEANEKHGFSQPLREAMAQWMVRWLRSVETDIQEAPATVLTVEEAQCTPSGRVNDLPGARSYYDLLAERADTLKTARAQWQASVTEEEKSGKIRELIQSAAEPIASSISAVSEETLDGMRLESLVFGHDGVHLPAVLLTPASAPREVLIIADPAGKSAVLGDSGRAFSAVREGAAVLAIDLRGVGETESTSEDHGWDHHLGNEITDYLLAYLLGKSYVGMRADDLQAAAAYCRERFGEGLPIRIEAKGETAVPALHAAALAPEFIQSVRLEDIIPSWDAVMREPRARQQMINTVHGALQFYDLPDLLEMCGERAEVVSTALPVF